MVPKHHQLRSRTFTFTYFPSDVEREIRYFQNLCAKKCIKAMFMGLEYCPTSLREHFQGFVRFTAPKTWRAVKQKVFQLDKLHLEKAERDDETNRNYCLAYGKHLNKEGHIRRVIDYGECAVQGKRNDITRAIEILNSSGKMGDVLDVVYNYQAIRHSELWLKYKEKPREIDPSKFKFINIHGPAGSGKTRAVYEFCAPKLPFKPISKKWWEGYDADEIILLDDIRGDFCKYHELLTLTDIYPYRVETKGGSRQMKAHTIFVTTPIPLVEIWSHRTEEDIKQLSRRITHTIHIDDIEKLKSL